MGLTNAAVVCGGRVCKVIAVEKGFATVVWIDHRDQIITRSVPAAACVKFSDAVRPRSFWPDVNMPLDIDLEASDELAARRNRKRTSKPVKKSA
jgi:hypothetical protein